jgi:hypothetical protein
MENEGQINKRIDFKDITIGTRKFRLHKFDALTGSYMLFKLVGIIAPIFKDMDTKKAKEKLQGSGQNESKNVKEEEITGSDMANILTEITKLPKEDFDYIQKNCLMVTNEIYVETSQVSPPVLNEYGTWGTMDIDMPLVLNLTIQSLIFNVSGFFGGSLSDLNLEGLNIFQ